MIDANVVLSWNQYLLTKGLKMFSPASSGKLIPALFIAGTLITGYILRERKIDQNAIEVSRNALQKKREEIAKALKEKENLIPSEV